MISRFQQFSSSISCIYKYIQKIERDEMKKYGLKGPHTQCLITMNHFPEGITISKLCEICDKDKAAVSRTISELEKKSLVKREVANDTNYRTPVKLTEEGKKAASQVCERAQKAVEAAGKGLNDSNRKIFYETLDLIASNLEVITKEGIPE